MQNIQNSFFLNLEHSLPVAFVFDISLMSLSQIWFKVNFFDQYLL